MLNLQSTLVGDQSTEREELRPDRRSGPSIVRRHVSAPPPRGLELMAGSAAPRKLAKTDAPDRAQAQKRARDPFFMSSANDDDGGQTLGFFHWPQFLRAAFQVRTPHPQCSVEG